MAKKIGRTELFTVALGSVIGWGAFMLPGNFFLQNAGVMNTLIGFAIATVMIALIEKNYALLMSKYHSLGGEYTFARQSFGDKAGFATGWLLLLAYVSIIPLNATAVPMVFEKILPFYHKGPLLYSVADYPVYLTDLLVSVVFILGFTLVQLKGLAYSSRLQNLTVFALMVSVGILLLLTLVDASEAEKANFDSNLGHWDTHAIIRIIAFAPWAFIGFDTVAQVASESRVKPKAASTMAMIAVVFGALVYNGINVITAYGVPNEALTGDTWATGDAVFNLMGGVALMIIGVAMLGAVLSGLNGFFMSATRLTLAMVSDQHHDNMALLKRITLFVTAISILVPFFGRNALFWFVDVSSVGASFAYLMTSLAAYKWATTRTAKGFAVLGTLASLAFLLFLLTPAFDSNIPTVSAVVLVAWCAAGTLVYQWSPLGRLKVAT